ncbi:MAG: hypothetical protein A3D31_12790 [Candidatus Fluviicola riflensis]|nr:MAG: hypothetical protein CHH17_17230 [Candidatus Fluviicola riflensis]OGS77860.1 MAG: hypothetical protein A3D31_12790 [Candidatus Fluviicola riflensis]OGS84925.1 MAG: hypothetical protein A2724_09725 [Fluviicola sp. RIFCSPHIGHO2_01_FULL_43_53]OGS89197.1 MAG: hypothetical protein A3E30_04030 [Fluviicola sp. RIFCSPHIGHO2_12_FULL_43_24]
MKATSLFRTTILSGALAITTLVPATDSEETQGTLSFNQGTGTEILLAQTRVPGERRRVRRRTRRRVNRRHERRENKMINYSSAELTNLYFWSPAIA